MTLPPVHRKHGKDFIPVPVHLQAVYVLITRLVRTISPLILTLSRSRVLLTTTLGATMISDLQNAKCEVTSAMVVLGQKSSQLPARERELRRYEMVIGDTYWRLNK